MFLAIESMTAQETTPAPGVNGRIAFTRSTDNGLNPEIYVMDSDGSNQTNLTNDPEGRRRWGWHGDFGPAWSPDGAKIAFASQRYPDFLDKHIYVMNADGSNQIRLTNNNWNRGAFHSGLDRGPAWSPDGSKIAFASSATNYLQIYVMDADGSNPIPLTSNPPYGDEAPAWSPDGSRIAFMHYGAPGTSEIYAMNADGSDPVRLTSTPGRANELPVWSPDGTRIAFDSNRGSNGFAIYVMGADGSNQIALSNDPGSSFGPEWSPDGTKIAFTASAGLDHWIFVMDADGSNSTRLVDGDAPRWHRLPDSVPVAPTLGYSATACRAGHKP